MKVLHSNIALNDVDWRVIKSEFDCYGFKVNNTTDVVLAIRTDAADPATEVLIQPMQDYIFAEADDKNTRVQMNAVLAWGKLSAGAGDIKRISKE